MVYLSHLTKKRSELYKTERGVIPENLFFKSAEGARGVAPNLSGKRTERLLVLLTLLHFSELLNLVIPIFFYKGVWLYGAVLKRFPKSYRNN